MVGMARMLIKANRTGSWLMHLQAVSNCLTVFAALQLPAICSLLLYLQQMSNLEEKHPYVYRKFLDGFHVVRRSNQCWAGLSSDLVIEQTLMRSLKSTAWRSNSRQWDDRGHAKPLDLICTCNIRVQQCDAGFHRPDQSAIQRLN